MQAVNGKSTHSEGYYFADKNAETRTDGGGEFCNKLWDSYCKEFGIVHETTSPYSSQFNGVVERANRTVIERIRVLMHDSGFINVVRGGIYSPILEGLCSLGSTP
jgi:transposase InsO family protein